MSKLNLISMPVKVRKSVSPAAKERVLQIVGRFVSHWQKEFQSGFAEGFQAGVLRGVKARNSVVLTERYLSSGCPDPA